ncbi:RpiB/LacA/LacB family sugar-phosphate isomerase [Candidatus Saccharibacteria bacterium]|nr:RpiB/LacA/LacB family sugar-phosphate isomerase [Candidatus Saccharibacteria bacterium]
MQVFLSSDHRGFILKSKLTSDLAKTQLASGNQISIVDLGPNAYNQDDDFNDAAISVVKAIKENTRPGDEEPFGILICGSAIGVSIQANRFRGIRAAVITDIETAVPSREHDNANIICISADRLARAKDPLESEAEYENILAIIEAFLNTPFSGKECYERRIKRLDEETI